MDQQQTWPTDHPTVGHPPQDQLNDQWSIGLWWSEKSDNARLLYGWAVPVQNAPQKWIKSTPKNSIGFITFVGGSWHSVKTMLAELAAGNSVSEASSQAGFAEPPKQIRDARVIHNSTQHEVGSWTLQHTKQMNWQFGNVLTVPQSPSNEAPVIAQSLLLLDKRKLIEDILGKKPNKDDVRKLLHDLSNVVGLCFYNHDFERLGNLEVIRPLGQYPSEESFVQVDTNTDGIYVSINWNSISDHEEIWVRCINPCRK